MFNFIYLNSIIKTISLQAIVTRFSLEVKFFLAFSIFFNKKIVNLKIIW